MIDRNRNNLNVKELNLNINQWAIKKHCAFSPNSMHSALCPYQKLELWYNSDLWI